MSSSARDLLVRGKAAAKANDIDEARFYLEWVLRTDADHYQKIEAWYWLAQISADPKEKRDYLENILAHDPGHAEARRSLALLDGRLKPNEVIDPNRLPLNPSAPAAPQRVQTDQFTCPHCNGQMRYTPDGQALLCPYCQHHVNLSEMAQSIGESVEEQDFAVALATVKGHSHAVAMQTFQCQGCGANFLVAPAVLSLSCPYCASAHVIKQAEQRTLLPPEGVVPFSLSQSQARRQLQEWLKANGLLKTLTAFPRGLYLPVWTFDIGGEIRWQYKAIESRRSRFKTIRQSSSRAVFYDDILVPASPKFTSLADEFRQYQLSQLQPYDPAYLSDWPAETYQISTADASLTARRLAYERARQEVMGQVITPLFETEDLTFSSAGLIVNSFKLILLPAWLGYYHYQAKRYHVFINGHTGQVKGTKPGGVVKSWWDKLLGQ